jgi:geranylgeranyl diphosphate synthase, type II
MLSPETLQQRVNKAISTIVLPSAPTNLYDPVVYTLSQGGKRLRPMLVLAACDMLHGVIEEAVHPAVGIEIFHNFTLLHDDIMDQAPLRRGKETVYKKWNSNIAILSGDTMFALANREIVKTRTDVIPVLVELFNTTAIQVCEGQQYDMDFETQADVTISGYLEMIRLKTAVLLACSLKTGAIIAGASHIDQGLIYDAGINLGMAFQLKDDYLDTFGDEKVFGKTPSGDILAGKKTWLFLRLLEKTGGNRNKLLELYDRHSAMPPAEKTGFFKAEFIAKGIPEEINDLIDQYYAAVNENLEKLAVPAERKTVLMAMIDSLVSREK